MQSATTIQTDSMVVAYDFGTVDSVPIVTTHTSTALYSISAMKFVHCYQSMKLIKRH